MKKTMIVLVSIVIIIAMLIVVGKRILFPQYDEIEATGQYEIACEDYWVTEDKADPFLNDGSLREIQVRTWYPKDYDNPDAASLPQSALGSSATEIFTVVEWSLAGYLLF